MKEKINLAIERMSSYVTMNSKHRYQDETGTWYQGVSTVSGITPKDWLAAWGAKEAVKFLGYTDYDDLTYTEKCLKRIQQLDVKGWLKALKEAKGAHSKKGKQAMADGTKGHAWLEEFVKSRIAKKNPPEVPEDILLKRACEQFIAWEMNNVKEWIASEAKVAHKGEKFAGTLDAIATLIDGRLAVVDFKFASHFSTDYWLQTAGYAACFEPFDIKFDARVIIRLPKTPEIEAYNEKTYTYYMKPNNLEVEEVPTPYEFDRNAFLACLAVKKWCNYVEKDY